jgi:hypothetical protein
MANNEANSSTPHSSAASPDKLVYMILFQGANPRLHIEGIVFVKSKLEFLPDEVLVEPPPEYGVIATEDIWAADDDVLDANYSTFSAGGEVQKQTAPEGLGQDENETTTIAPG